MNNFDIIAIIVNPNSTGPSVRMGQDLKTELEDKGYAGEVVIMKTSHAGHARKMAAKLARDYDKPLIISSSGDGGYNEVVNGLLADADNNNAVAAVLPAGNANDHGNAIGSPTLTDAVIENKTRKIDVLAMTWNNEKRYAHSYIGFGVTPAVARELNKTDLNHIKELMIVIKTFQDFEPFSATIDNKKAKYDSILARNIDRMAKISIIGSEGQINDGEFEISMVRHSSRATLVLRMLRSMIHRAHNKKKMQKFELIFDAATSAQTDGEVVEIPPLVTVAIKCEKKRLRTLA